MNRIVVGYPDLLNLYGGWAAPELLRRRLESAGETAAVDTFSVGSAPDLTHCDLLLFPAGTERALAAALDDLAPHRESLRAYLEAGGLALCTGNAGALLCRSFTDLAGRAHEGLGFLDAEARQIPKRRYAEYILSSPLLGPDVIGAINTSVEFAGAETPLWTVEYESEPLLPGKTEGFVRGNAFATQLVGPLLVRNPRLLDLFCAKLCGHELPPGADDWYVYACRGYESALATLKKEAGKA